MAEKIKRPDFSSVKKEYKELGDYLRVLQTIVTSEGNAKILVRQKIHPAIEAAQAETLKSVSVDELNTVGHNIRVSALKNAGVHTLYDLSKLSQAKLDTIPGIGAETARKIRQIADEMIRKIKKTSGLKLTVDRPSPEAVNLIGALYVYIGVKLLAEKAKSLSKQYRKDVNEALASAKASKSGLRWLFSSRASKEKAAIGIEKIYELYTGDFGNAARALIEKNKEIQAATEKEWMADFAACASTYYAELEQLG